MFHGLCNYFVLFGDINNIALGICFLVDWDMVCDVCRLGVQVIRYCKRYKDLGNGHWCLFTIPNCVMIIHHLKIVESIYISPLRLWNDCL